MAMPPQFHLYEGEAGDYTVKDPSGRLFQLRNLLDAMGFIRRQSGGEEVMVSCFNEGGGLLFEKLIGEEEGRFRLCSVPGFGVGVE
jgi:hypothetical protein